METNDFVLKRLPRGARPWAVLVGGVMCMVTFGIVYTCAPPAPPAPSAAAPRVQNPPGRNQRSMSREDDDTQDNNSPP
ncbi:unnamed protein product [Caenorhabditis nigoni]